ncbi:hypothetical protein C0995_001497 [Termitomyces sp. Mi166|nr:hypothetical protein C0995_001497 [Termitomyces sp. Mi166\
MGVSLGGERILRMEGLNGSDGSFDVPLPSGSVYLQRDAMRYQYKHSILKDKLSYGQDPRIGQRLSIMIRVRLPLIQSLTSGFDLPCLLSIVKDLPIPSNPSDVLFHID